jgi:DNA-binding CsgD family transcriptional regulator/archaellum biogenesis ATPase FlaH
MCREDFDNIYQNQLTPKQKEVIPSLLQGLSNKEIARILNVKNPNTITHRISSIRQKFDAIDKADLIYIFNKFQPELVSSEARKQAGIVESPITYEITYPECSEVLDSPFYIQRDDIDNRCQDLIDREGCLIRIKAPKQMGKTSLINRLVDRTEKEGNHIVYYDFSFIDINTLNNIDSFFYSLSSFIAEELSDLTNRNFDLDWNKNNSLTTECTKFLKRTLLEIERPLVLIFDETDRIFQYESVYQSFAPMLRYWHNKGKTSSVWKKLKLILAHSTEEYVKLDINQSPFTNVGETINLVDFTVSQVTELANRHGITDETVVNSLMTLVGGHPYLIRLALYHLAKENLSLKQLLAEAATDSGIYRDHLQRHLMRLQNNSSLETAFQQVVRSERAIIIREQHLKHKLEGMGLITISGNLASVRYELYRKYFNAHLF